MSARTFAFTLAVALAVVEAAVAVAVVVDAGHSGTTTTTLAVIVGASFVAAGLIALRRRPENRTGVYLAAVGYLWFLNGLGDSIWPIVSSAGMSGASGTR